ncbi:hypothetical protein [Streptomyces sp. NPDC006739]|uniref:hypothetical protein n=1 Tax=Streptomyces sp. NPDC006739 TaxID=3364763 RepID=UPI00368737D9
MNTRALNSLADLICRALGQGRTPMGIAMAIDSAGRHMSPETAAEIERLRARVDEVERAYIFDTAELKRQIAELQAERHVTNEALADVTVALRGAQAETDPGACQGCGSLPEQWCPDCAACEKGCFGGFDGNECTHANAGWRQPSAEVPADKLTQLLAPTQVLREDPHDSPLHHSYRLSHDLPELGGAL